jgi:hypothetical protein
MGRRRLVGEKIFTAPSQGGEEYEEETEDGKNRSCTGQVKNRLFFIYRLKICI